MRRSVAIALSLVPIAAIASAWLPVARITVSNASGQPLTDLHVSGRCISRSVARLESNESETLWTRTCGETSLVITFKAESVMTQSEQIGYVDAPPPHCSEILVDARLSVRHLTCLGWYGLLIP
jgi:hypothetical protein